MADGEIDDVFSYRKGRGKVVILDALDCALQADTLFVLFQKALTAISQTTDRYCDRKSDRSTSRAACLANANLAQCMNFGPIQRMTLAYPGACLNVLDTVRRHSSKIIVSNHDGHHEDIDSELIILPVVCADQRLVRSRIEARLRLMLWPGVGQYCSPRCNEPIVYV